MDFKSVINAASTMLAKWSPAVLYGSTAVMVVTLISSWYVFCFSPLTQSITTYIHDIEELKKKKLLAEKKVTSKDAFKERLQFYEQQLSSRKQPSGNLQIVINTFPSLCTKHGVSLIHTSSTIKKKYTHYETFMITYVISGVFEKMRLLFKEFQAHPSLLCKKCIIKRAQEGLQCSIAIAGVVPCQS